MFLAPFTSLSIFKKQKSQLKTSFEPILATTVLISVSIKQWAADIIYSEEISVPPQKWELKKRGKKKLKFLKKKRSDKNSVSLP